MASSHNIYALAYIIVITAARLCAGRYFVDWFFVHGWPRFAGTNEAFINPQYGKKGVSARMRQTMKRSMKTGKSYFADERIYFDNFEIIN